MWPSTSRGMPELAQREVADLLEGRQRARPSASGHFGSASVRRLSIATANRGAWAATASSLISSSTRCGRGSVRWKAWPSRSGSWAMCSSAAATQSTGTTLVSPRSRPTSGTHSGSTLAQPLDRLEEVVGTVDLVHLAGLRVADDDPRPVDPPGHVGLLADDPLGLELGAVIGRGQPLALVEHRLVEDPAVVAGDGDRGDVVQVLGVERPGQFDGVGRAADVDGGVALRRERSCRRRPPGGRSGRSCRAARRRWSLSMPSSGRRRSPTTGLTRSAADAPAETAQRSTRSSRRPLLFSRTST